MINLSLICVKNFLQAMLNRLNGSGIKTVPINPEFDGKMKRAYPDLEDTL